MPSRRAVVPVVLPTVLPALLLAVSLHAVSAAGELAAQASDGGGTAPAPRPFGIRVVDAGTGRGVPLVRLETVHGVVFVTDSAGWIAFREPGLLGRTVYFHVSSDGYEFPADGFGYRGVRLDTDPGGRARIEVRRTQPAERLYRVTGEGIYRDSVLLGEEVPLANPLLAGGVLGQDTVQARVYRGRLHWFWGDTNRAAYPLGNFATSGAVSRLPGPGPGRGGLDPSVGVDLDYFVDEDGSSRPMMPLPGQGVVWIHGLFVLRGPDGESMFAHFARREGLGKVLQHGIARYDDASDRFVVEAEFPLEAPLFPRGQSLQPSRARGERIRDEPAGGPGGDHVVFCAPFPVVRVPARREAVVDPERYEAFTCLLEGAVLPPDGGPEAALDLPIERGADGRAVWGWKRGTSALDVRHLEALVTSGRLAVGEVPFVLRGRREGESGDGPGTQAVTAAAPAAEESGPKPVGPLFMHRGSVHWNEHRQRWILIANRFRGEDAFLGEVWYAEADALEGPWHDAMKVATHHGTSFYNPAQHPGFDRDGGRVVFFEGTYSRTFSRSARPTPRYDYNQLMYRLDLGALGLPKRSRGGGGE